MANKKGRIELADGGTLFLDEIGEMAPELQVKVLRLVQQGEIEKVGATQPARVDVRIIAATHRDLKAMIEDGTFREDLYYRLAVIPLSLPPLRERAEDIPDLVQHFFLRTKEKVGRPNAVLPPSLMKYFQNYRWPGNIRELENVIERIVVLSREEEITVSDLPDFLRQEHVSVDTLQLNLPPQGNSLEAIEKELIERALNKFNWNQTHTAKYLDISRKALMYRMDKHGIRRPGHESTLAAQELEEAEPE
jgi:two-component system NtrC family response regulator